MKKFLAIFFCMLLVILTSVAIVSHANVNAVHSMSKSDIENMLEKQKKAEATSQMSNKIPGGKL